MDIQNIEKKKNYILLTMSEPSSKMEAISGIDRMAEIAYDLRDLNGGKAVTAKAGALTLSLSPWPTVLNSDNDEGENEG